MATLLDMKLGKDKQISLSSHETIHALIDKFRVELVNAPQSYLGREMSQQAVVNGLLLWLNMQPAAERLRILKRAIGLLEDAVVGRPVEGIDSEGGPSGPAASLSLTRRPGDKQDAPPEVTPPPKRGRRK